MYQKKRRFFKHRNKKNNDKTHYHVKWMEGEGRWAAPKGAQERYTLKKACEEGGFTAKLPWQRDGELASNSLMHYYSES